MRRRRGGRKITVSLPSSVRPFLPSFVHSLRSFVEVGSGEELRAHVYDIHSPCSSGVIKVPLRVRWNPHIIYAKTVRLVTSQITKPTFSRNNNQRGRRGQEPLVVSPSFCSFMAGTGAGHGGIVVVAETRFDAGENNERDASFAREC